MHASLFKKHNNNEKKLPRSHFTALILTVCTLSERDLELSLSESILHSMAKPKMYFSPLPTLTEPVYFEYKGK